MSTHVTGEERRTDDPGGEHDDRRRDEGRLEPLDRGCRPVQPVTEPGEGDVDGEGDDGREPDRRTDLARRVDDGGRDPGVVVVDPVDACDGRSDEAGGDTESEQNHPGEDVGDVAPLDRDVREQPQTESRAGEAERQQPAHAESWDQRRECTDPDHHRERERDVGQTGLQRRPAEDLLHVEGEAEEEGAHGRGDQDADDRGGDPVAALEHGLGDQRVGRYALAQDERHEEQDGARHLEHEGRARPRRGALGQQRVDGETDTRGDQRGAGVVEPALLRTTTLRHRPGRQKHSDESDRHVDEEHPAPTGVLGEDAADDDAGHATDTTQTSPHAQGLRPLPLVGEHEGDQRQGRGRDECRSGALEESGRDQQPRSPRDPRQQARDREHAHADHEQASTTHDVGESSAEQQQPTEGKRVGVHDPGETGLADAEIPADLGQCDVDDGVVEGEHDLRQRQDHERLPAGGVDPYLRGGQPRCAGERHTVSPRACSAGAESPAPPTSWWPSMVEHVKYLGSLGI